MPRPKGSGKKGKTELEYQPTGPMRPLGPLVMVVTLYPTSERVRDKKTGRMVLHRQHPLPSSNTYYRMKHSGRVYNKDHNRFRNAAIDLDMRVKEATKIAVRRALDEYGWLDPPELVAAYCMIRVFYPDRLRRDQHNTVYKAAFDAMKNCGVWQDDNRVELYMPLAVISRHNPRIEFHIYELPEGETGESPLERVPDGWDWDEELSEDDTYLT